MKWWMTVLAMSMFLALPGCPEVEFEGDDTTTNTNTGTDTSFDGTDPFPNDSETATDDDTSTTKKNCGELTVFECEQRDECRLITARPLDTENRCLPPGEPVGCMEADRGCTEAIETAVDPDGNCWWFSNGCIPASWSGDSSNCPDGAIGWEPCEQTPKACEELSVVDCEQREDCVTIHGRRGLIEQKCLMDSEPLGCMVSGTGCDTAIVFATDPQGDCYWFPSSCLPTGWSTAPKNSECSYSTFPDEESCDTTTLACQDLTVAQCADRQDCRTISGRHVDTDKKCVFEPEDLGCLAADMGCTGAETLALDPGGECYLFGSGCLPRGWTNAPNDHPDCNHSAVGDFASCEETH